jgi:hypothetical protein
MRAPLLGDYLGDRLDEEVRVLVREDERRADLEDVLVAAGAADQDSVVAELVDDALGLLRGGELDADE